MGPEIALLPYLEMTSGLDDVTKGIIVRKMLRTAGVAALVLIGTGELLARLLHFSTGSLSIAGGVILVIIATTMVLGTGGGQEGLAGKERDPIRLALFPPTVPYLLNPAGVVTLVTLSAEAVGVSLVGRSSRQRVSVS